MAGFDFTAFDALTFDCYGTLIDWETGIGAAFEAALASRGVQAEGDDLLERYARHEGALEAGPYLRYREVLALAFARVCGELGFEPSVEEGQTFAASIARWPPFGDSHEALTRLATRFKLAVITNCDDDLFALSNERLGVRFDWVITAERVGSYKPDHRNFEVAFKTIGLPRQRILHVAQSLYHDHVPAKQLGLTSVWVNRRHGQPGFGATLPASIAPDLTVPDMATLADLATAGS